MTFTERWCEKARAKGAPVCVGLDPVLEKLPPALFEGTADLGRAAAADAIERFCLGVIDAVADVVPCVKPQLACFERYGSAGLAAYERVASAAKDAGLLVIADAKRGDIGISAEHYAAAFFEGEYAADALTVSPYLGPDTLEPFMDAAQRNQGAVFVLVRTSNPGSGVWQGLETADASRVVDHVGDFVEQQSDARRGALMFGPVGAVVGATHPREAAALRQRMPHVLFLVPGFGAQGGGAEDVRACFHARGHARVAEAGTGAIITASRSVIYAPPSPGQSWQDAVRHAAWGLRDQVAGAVQASDS
ncbi:MAG: orotidine-5'-phosphate decarboxylase [Planctomycetota bacterium]